MADQTKKDVKSKRKSKTQSTQLYLKIAEIRDSAVILKNGGLRAVLKTSSMNLNLKSEAKKST